MPTADELRAGIHGGVAALRASIQVSEANWDTPKGTADDGEAGWSPRQVAEHVIPSTLMFANGICAACGYEGPENPLSSTRLRDPGRRAGRARRRHLRRRKQGQARPGRRAWQVGWWRRTGRCAGLHADARCHVALRRPRRADEQPLLVPGRRLTCCEPQPLPWHSSPPPSWAAR